ncbi:type II secretion system F family protein [Candidatus Saccharibacteria bacterium]|nr:type II secretion system F family protein [Candidatus Saccharibacteria bacterium]
MLSFDYTAKDPSTGKTVKAEVQADSQSAAIRLLQAQGLVPLDITLGKGIGSARKLKRIKVKDKVLFSRQLSTLINAGLPLVQSLRNVSSQTTNKSFKAVINQIITDVEAGSTLANAFGKHPAVFNSVYLALVSAGESSGTLDQALERLADQQEKDADIMAKIRGAMIYPLIVLAVMLAVLGFMLVKVLPQVKSLYSTLPGATLPFVTTALMAVSDFVITYWWVVVILVALSAVFGSRWGRTVGGKRFMDRMYMRAPLISPLFMKLYMARFARTGTTLVASGVPIIQVLEITGRAVNNVHIQDSLQAAAEKVKAGKSLGDSLAGDPNFLDLVPNMIKIGEQSGSMEAMLAKAADYYEKELDNEVKNIQTIIEPVMMVMMGIIAFIIVAAVLLPIYGLAGQSALTG